MFCPKCGHEMTDDAVFCSKCGCKMKNFERHKDIYTKDNKKIVTPKEETYNTNKKVNAWLYLISWTSLSMKQFTTIGGVCVLGVIFSIPIWYIYAAILTIIMIAFNYSKQSFHEGRYLRCFFIVVAAIVAYIIVGGSGVFIRDFNPEFRLNLFSKNVIVDTSHSINFGDIKWDDDVENVRRNFAGIQETPSSKNKKLKSGMTEYALEKVNLSIIGLPITNKGDIFFKFSNNKLYNIEVISNIVCNNNDFKSTGNRLLAEINSIAKEINKNYTKDKFQLNIGSNNYETILDSKYQDNTYTWHNEVTKIRILLNATINPKNADEGFYMEAFEFEKYQ